MRCFCRDSGRFRVVGELCSIVLNRSMVAWLLVIAHLTSGTMLSQASESPEIETAARAYEQGDYKKVIRIVHPLLYPSIRLGSQDSLIRAYRYLGVSYLFENKKDHAEKQFLAILSMVPDYRLDPLIEPISAIEFLEDIKRRNADRLNAIRERSRLEERRLREAELERQKPRLSKQPVAPPPSGVHIVERHSYWLNYVPFGVGQFQNGHTTKGYLLLGTQIGLGALSMGTALALRFLYPSGKVPMDETHRANALVVTQVVSGGISLGLMAYGILDALYHYKPEVVLLSDTKRTFPRNNRMTAFANRKMAFQLSVWSQSDHCTIGFKGAF